MWGTAGESSWGAPGSSRMSDGIPAILPNPEPRSGGGSGTCGTGLGRRRRHRGRAVVAAAGKGHSQTLATRVNMTHATPRAADRGRDENTTLRRALGFRDLTLYYIVTTFSIRWIATAAA